MALARRPKREDEVELSVDVVAILRTGTIVFFVAHSPCFRLSYSSSSYADASSVHGDDQFEHHPSKKANIPVPSPFSSPPSKVARLRRLPLAIESREAMAERRAGSILLLIASLLLSWSRRLVPIAEAMWLTIPSPRTKCVSAEIESNVVVLANYYIIDDEHTHLRTATISSRNSARLTIPEGPSIACNTAKAIEWDAVRLNNVDPSGRAALGVHLSPYDKRVVAGNVGMVHSEVGGDVRSMMEVSAAGLAIRK